MKVLVTGGAGFIGSHLVDGFLAAGHEVVVVDNLSTGSRAFLAPEVIFANLSLLDPELEELLHTHRPDLLCHHAAHVNVRESVEDPIHDATQNLLGTLHLLEAARKCGVSRILFASSGGAVYGIPREDPVPETHPTQPLSPYGGAKLACEQYLWMYGANHGISSVSLRYANVYGPRQNPEGEGGVVAVFCRKLVTGQRPVIFGDGEQTRDFVYVADVVAANLNAAALLMDATPEAPIQLSVNIGTGQHTSVNLLSRLLNEIMQTDVVPEHGPARVGELRAISLATQRAEDMLGWKPRVSLVEGLRETAAYFQRVGDGPLTR